MFVLIVKYRITLLETICIVLCMLFINGVFTITAEQLNLREKIKIEKKLNKNLLDKTDFLQVNKGKESYIKYSELKSTLACITSITVRNISTL